MNNLAVAYRVAGKLDRALPLLEETLQLRKAKLGVDHADTLQSIDNLATGYQAAGKLDQALPLYEETFRLYKAKLGADHPETLQSMSNLAVGYRALGKLDQALPLLEENLKLRKAKLGLDHPDTFRSMSNLGVGYRAAGKMDLALPLLQEAATGIEKQRFQHQSAGPIVKNLIRCLEIMQRLDQAEAWQRKWLAVVKEQAGADSLAYGSELAALGRNLLMQKNWSGAEVVLRESVALNEKKQTPTAWTVFDAKGTLGGALLGQKRYAEAEPLLVAGYEGMKQHEGQIPPQEKVRVTEGIERLVQLYEATGKPEETAKWRKLLAQTRDSGKQPAKLPAPPSRP
jgi:eukaryotic-like serine/threonine-protein kinase